MRLGRRRWTMAMSRFPSSGGPRRFIAAAPVYRLPLDCERYVQVFGPQPAHDLRAPHIL